MKPNIIVLSGGCIGHALATSNWIAAIVGTALVAVIIIFVPIK